MPKLAKKMGKYTKNVISIPYKQLSFIAEAISPSVSIQGSHAAANGLDY